MQELKEIIKEQNLTFEVDEKIIELIENSQEQKIVVLASLFNIFFIESEEFFEKNRFALKRKRILIENFSKKIEDLLPVKAKKTVSGRVLPEFGIVGEQKTFAFSSNFVKFDKTGLANFGSEGMLETHALAHGFFNIVSNKETPKVDIFLEVLTKLDSFTSIDEVKNLIKSIEIEAEAIFLELIKFKDNIIDNR